MLDKGIFFQAINDYNQGLTRYNEILQKRLLTMRGYAWMKLKKYDQAIADFNKAIELVPQYERAYIHRAIIWSEIGDYDRAINDDTKAIQIDPLSKVAYMNRGLDFLHKMMKFAENKKRLRVSPKAEDRIILKELVNRAIADASKNPWKLMPNYTDAYQNLQAAYNALQILNQ